MVFLIVFLFLFFDVLFLVFIVYCFCFFVLCSFCVVLSCGFLLYCLVVFCCIIFHYKVLYRPLVVSKLYGVKATIIKFVFVLYCTVSVFRRFSYSFFYRIISNFVELYYRHYRCIVSYCFFCIFFVYFSFCILSTGRARACKSWQEIDSILHF